MHLGWHVVRFEQLHQCRLNVLGLGRFHGLAEGPQDPLGVGVADGEFAIGSAGSELVEPVGHRLLAHAAQHGVDELGRSGADAVPGEGDCFGNGGVRGYSHR